ncbi:MAG: DUF423 domain-containing protein [Rhizobiaceae bacterium]
MTSNRFFVLAAGLAGAAGVALSAAAAHLAGSPNIGTAASMLLMHAPALLALGLFAPGRVLRLAGFVLLAGLAVFSGDLLLREFAGFRLFPMAAPIGGSLMIAGWLGAAASALMDKR